MAMRSGYNHGSQVFDMGHTSIAWIVELVTVYLVIMVSNKV
jgi:hypothetical protein